MRSAIPRREVVGCVAEVPARPFLGASPALPRGGGGGRACLFQNGGCLLLTNPPPPGDVGVAQEWVGGFEGKGRCWSVGEWVECLFS